MSTVYKQTLLIMGLVIGIPGLFLGVLIINWFVYPFSSAHPNFAEVESVFNKLQIPADWQINKTDENSGIAGRQCPIESESMCFHKSIEYKLPENLTKEQAENIVKSSGCVSPAYKDESSLGQPEGFSYSYECFTGAGVNVSISVNGKDKYVYISTASR